MQLATTTLSSLSSPFKHLGQIACGPIIKVNHEQEACLGPYGPLTLSLDNAQEKEQISRMAFGQTAVSEGTTCRLFGYGTPFNPSD